MRSFQTELRLIVNDAISQTEGSFAKAALDAIPPLTLKTEDGRFVKVRRLTDSYEIDAAMADHRPIYLLAENQS